MQDHIKESSAWRGRGRGIVGSVFTHYQPHVKMFSAPSIVIQLFCKFWGWPWPWPLCPYSGKGAAMTSLANQEYFIDCYLDPPLPNIQRMAHFPSFSCVYNLQNLLQCSSVCFHCKTKVCSLETSSDRVKTSPIQGP